MTTKLTPPKEGTKEAKLVSKLNGSGTTLSQLSEHLGWQPHTVRAALTRLRKRGYVIDRTAKTKSSSARFKIRAGA